MLNNIFNAIEQWMRTLLTSMVHFNLENMVTDVNDKTGEIAAQVGMTPMGWNSGIFQLIRNLSDTVILPIAGMVLTFVLCVELIGMMTEKNNMHEIDTWMFFKYFIKAWIAIWLVSNTFTLTMAVFDVGQYAVNKAAGVISGQTAMDISNVISAVDAEMAAMGVGELLGLAIETFIVSFCMKILAVLIMVILYVRMIEIYLYTSIAPIPFATLTNREWGQVGTNYLRGVFALAFQAFLMMICVGIYAVLVSTAVWSPKIHAALFGVMGYTIILCFSLLKTGSLSKQIFNSH